MLKKLFLEHLRDFLKLSNNFVKAIAIVNQGLLVDKKAEKKIVKCQTCNASNEVVTGQTNYCKYCDSLIIL